MLRKIPYPKGKNMIRKTLILILMVALPFLSAGSAMAAKKDKDPAQGREQLVEAFDAAFTRVVDEGIYRLMITTFNEPIAGVIDAEDYITNISDCLPNTELTPYPEKPVGLFKQILADGVIRRGNIDSGAQTNPGGTTSDWFTRGDDTVMSGHSDQSAFLLEALLEKIADHYGTGPITVVSVDIPFPFNTTSALIDGIFGFAFGPGGLISMPGVTVDILDQFNAKGGRTENLRRIGSRRETCTFSASGQFIHVPQGSPFTITSIDDLLANTSIRICTGNLSTQLADTYFPDHTIFASRGEDITECYERLGALTSDIMINSLPVNPTAAQVGVPGGPALLPSVDTHIVAGTPYWVAMEGIKCEAVPSPPPPFPGGPQFPEGTFRECERINR